MAWEGLTENLELVTARLVLHAAISETPIASWAEVFVHEDRDARVAHRVAVRSLRDSGGLVRVDDGEGDEGVDDDGEQIP